MKRATLAIVAALLLGRASASEEEYLPWVEVRVAGPERGDVGKVVFSATLEGDRYRSVSVDAFGRTLVLDKADLAKLDGLPLASLRITHEAGYERLGGHTVHFRLKVTRTTDGKAVEESGGFSVSRGKGLAMHARAVRELPR